jgi:CubicO group peptidase (beta-lactamase class C family)
VGHARTTDLDAVNARVDAMFERPDSEGNSLALVIQQRGEVVVERYGTQPANVFEAVRALDADSTLVSWSMAKSITHAAIGILVADGLLDVESPASVPEWAGTEKEPITVLDLLEMRSGLRFVEDYVDDQTSNCIEMLFGDSGPSHMPTTFADSQCCWLRTPRTGSPEP